MYHYLIHYRVTFATTLFTIVSQLTKWDSPPTDEVEGYTEGFSRILSTSHILRQYVDTEDQGEREVP